MLAAANEAVHTGVYEETITVTGKKMRYEKKHPC